METKHLYGSVQHNSVLLSYYMFQSLAYMHKFERKLKYNVYYILLFRLLRDRTTFQVVYNKF